MKTFSTGWTERLRKFQHGKGFGIEKKWKSAMILASKTMTSSSSTTTRTSPALSEGQKAALISLLADDDPAVYQLIREKLLSFGQEAIGWLRPHTLSSDPVMRRHALEIAHHLSRQASDNRFLTFCLSQGGDLDIEEGSWLLAQTQYPDINVAAYQALLDSYAGDLRERVDFAADTEDVLRTLNQYLFSALKYNGNEHDYYDPENSYLNRVMDRRTGNPISLCLIYILLSRRLRLPIVGIGMPGHFICRYQTSREEIFIDAFNQGRLLTKSECIRYLKQTGHGFQEGYLAPVNPRRMLLRMCTNLHQIYYQLELAEEAARLQRYLVALAK
jgi:regulator of sirC expression with transglutaminase-like and TPR domain